ncbi:hypothetical protein [Corallococcus sp. RDP092CA]|uniref:hypothetical protein n=1 Tax=Corallococcus sp. RDP092CA TaxID=3109369 RepID=UPI0035B2784F
MTTQRELPKSFGARLMAAVQEQLIANLEAERTIYFTLRKSVLKANAEMLKGFMEIVDHQLQQVEEASTPKPQKLKIQVE